MGGAKLALGLYRLMQSQNRASLLSIIGNTGDDLEMFGLRICPDLDTILYTLSGLANPVVGWGIEGDTFHTLEMLKRYGEDAWFWLGDRDFATHILTTQWLRAGDSLTEVIAKQAAQLGLECQLLPMADSDVRTIIDTDEVGEMPFQEYFVHRQAKDTVRGLRLMGAEQAQVSPAVGEALGQAGLIIICPSNPYLSVWPILAVPGMQKLLQTAQARGTKIVVVSPIVGGIALKGPAAAIMRSMGNASLLVKSAWINMSGPPMTIMRSMGQETEASALGVARLYQGLADVFVLDTVDADQESVIQVLGLQTLVTDTVMHSEADKIRLAAAILERFE